MNLSLLTVSSWCDLRELVYLFIYLPCFFATRKLLSYQVILPYIIDDGFSFMAGVFKNVISNIMTSSEVALSNSSDCHLCSEKAQKGVTTVP